VEKFIEESHRNLHHVVKFMKEREVHMIMRVADRVKCAIEEFRPKVPLMVALKKEGMRDRHWAAISQSVGFRVHPGDREDFCF
jgi:dynein heavy chain